MKYLKTYNIFEGRQRGSLYHIFDLEKCKFILDNNQLSSYKFGNISTTRNKNMNSYLGDASSSIFKIELDGDKLTNKYKIRPFRYKTAHAGYLEEFEEVIKTNKVDNLNKYVTKFIIIKSKVERLKDSGWFDSDGGFLNGERTTIPDFLKEHLTRIKELFGDIWIQDGNVIKQDDTWLESILNFPINKINHGYALYWRGYKRVKQEKWGHIIKDDIIPLDERNKKIEELVIGYDYEDLYLSSKDLEIPEKKDMEDYKLYIFDFEYDEEDVDGEIVKKAKLVDIKPL